MGMAVMPYAVEGSCNFSRVLYGRNQMRPNTIVNVMDRLGTFAGQQH